MADAGPSLIDIGVNLTHKSFRSDLSEVVDRALGVGVRQMVLTGTSVEGSREALALARQYPGTMFSTAGVHPHHASDFTSETLDQLRELAAEEPLVAIGECGLDFFRNLSTPEEQQRCFRAQLEVAVELGMPVFLHERDAHEAFEAILRDFMSDLRAVVVHCFTGSAESLNRYLEMGCLIGITGWVCDERRGEPLRRLVPAIPIDRLMIETDAPFLLPRDLVPKPKSTRNEPMHLPHIARAIADLRELDGRSLVTATTANARRFFQLPNNDEVSL